MNLFLSSFPLTKQVQCDKLQLLNFKPRPNLVLEFFIVKKFLWQTFPHSNVNLIVLLSLISCQVFGKLHQCIGSLQILNCVTLAHKSQCIYFAHSLILSLASCQLQGEKVSSYRIHTYVKLLVEQPPHTTKLMKTEDRQGER